MSSKLELAGFGLNTPEEEILENIKTNITRGLPQLQGHPPRPDHVCIVGGGWSLEDTFDELRALVWDNHPVLALNGAGQYLLERNIRPGAQIILDARPRCAGFVEEPIPGCKYFLASQCHPSVFEACEGRDVFIYHVVSTGDETERALLDRYYLERWIEVVGGSTVGLRSISLATFLGWQFMHLFGIDSCHAPDGRHHAYAQPWQDAEETISVWTGTKEGRQDREFKCSLWQASQAENFIGFVRALGGNFILTPHGDGLISHIMQTGAQIRRGDL